MSSNYDFYDKLNYLGGNLGLSPKMTEYLDLEVFFLECTLNLAQDTRTSLTILNWLYRYAQILSPSKIRRLIVHEEGEYCEKGLFVLLEFLQDHSLIGANWSILNEFSHKTDKNNLKLPKCFNPKPQKYLKRAPFVLKNCPEIYWRANGSHQVAADMRACMEKSDNFKSLYELAKKVHSPRSRVNYFFKSFSKLGVR